MKKPNVIYAEKLVSEYSEKENQSESKIKALRKLDQKVKNTAEIFAFSNGIVGSLIMGAGMSIAMKVIGNFAGQMAVGIVIGVFGMIMMVVNNYAYKKILAKSKKKHAFEIIELARAVVAESEEQN